MQRGIKITWIAYLVSFFFRLVHFYCSVFNLTGSLFCHFQSAVKPIQYIFCFRYISVPEFPFGALFIVSISLLNFLFIQLLQACSFTPLSMKELLRKPCLLGHLASSVSGACGSWSWGREIKPHVGWRDCLKKWIILKKCFPLSYVY